MCSAKEVTDSMAENTYKGVEHGYGKEANAVARGTFFSLR